MCKSKKFLQIYGRDFVGKTAYLVFFCKTADRRLFFASTRIRIFLQKGDNVFQVSRCCCNFALPKRSPGKCRYFQNPEYEETNKRLRCPL